MGPKDNFLTRAFNGNSLLHGLYMAIIAAIGSPIYQYAMSWAQSQPVPDIKTVVLSTIKIAVGAGVIYLGKNGFAGPSLPAAK